MENEAKLAGKLHAEGNSCAEAVVKACNESMNLNLSADAIRMSSGLGGGIGGAGCVCGALNGASMILGVIAGRTTVEEKGKPEIYKITREFQQRFVEHYGSSCCRVLKSPELKVSCDDLVMGTASMVADYIKEKGLK